MPTQKNLPVVDYNPRRDNVADLAIRLRDAGPVVLLRLLPVGNAEEVVAYAVTDYHALREILRDQDTFIRGIANLKDGKRMMELAVQGRLHPALAMLLFDSLLTRNGESHAALRKAISPLLLGPRINDEYGAQISGYAQALARGINQRLAEKEPALDFKAAFAKPLTSTVVSHIIGVSEVNASVLSANVDKLFAATDPHAFSNIHTLMIETSKRASKGSILDQLNQKGNLPPEEIALMGTLLVIGGFDTTKAALTNGTDILLSEPHWIERIKEEELTWKRFIEELLRYASPIPTMPFTTPSRDVRVKGVRIPKGALMISPLQAANFSEQFGENAKSFNPMRSSTKKQLAFGDGAHNCVGAPLARTMLGTALPIIANQSWGIVGRVEEEEGSILSQQPYKLMIG